MTTLVHGANDTSNGTSHLWGRKMWPENCGPKFHKPTFTLPTIIVCLY